MLTDEDRVRLELRKTVKSQFLIFSKLYPELVDKQSVRYPIKDSLLAQLPELHGASALPVKPKPHLIKLNYKDFDQLLYIWEFCNSFSEYLEISEFKIEELRLALTYVEPEPVSLQEEESLDWNEQCRLKLTREKGFHMINVLHHQLALRYLADMVLSS